MKNNVRGSIIILEATALVIVAALVMRLKAGRDELPPVISIPESAVSYTQGDDPEVLLSGVTAFDERDGDVTDSILISTIFVTGDGRAIAVYHAKDSSNNTAAEERSIQFISDGTVGLMGIPVSTEPADIVVLPDEDGDDQPATQETDAGTGQSQISETDSQIAGEAQGADGGTDTAEGDGVREDAGSAGEDSSHSDADTSTPTDTQTENADSVLASYENMDPDSYTGEDMQRIGSALRSETETAKAGLPEGSPTIGLMAHAIFQDVGSSLNPLDLISSIDDAEDSIEYIFGQIHVEGNAGFTTEYPGKYLFRYYVIDSDGNTSNIARLYIVVR